MPDKETLLSQIKTAISKAPDIEASNTTDTVHFKVDGGADILNTKKSLQFFYDKIRKTPAKMTLGDKKSTVSIP